MKRTILFLVVFGCCIGFCVPNESLSQEYSFDIEEFEKKPYEFSAAASFNPVVSFLNEESRLYRMKYLNAESEDFLDEYHLSLEAKASYEFSDVKLVSSGKYALMYNADNEWTDNFSLFELYAQYSPNTSFTTWLGKKSVKWGKGYIWNPVSFVGKQKDVNDVDASLEGYSVLMGEFVKSFDSKFQTLSLSPVIMPVIDDLNDGFTPVNSVSVALHAYMLIADTDVDIYLLTDDRENRKVGLDFARNLLSNWEIHAEWAYENSYDTWYLDDDYVLRHRSDDVINYLFGTRYLTSSNTTIIFEYLHNDAGYSEHEMHNFFNAADSAMADDNNQLLSVVRAFQKNQLSRQFLMQDYLYLKLSQPEPFDILYFTPSAYAVYNVDDNSSRIGIEVKYSRFTNLELLIRQNYFPSRHNTEFGEKVTGYKTEFYVKKYF